MCPHYLQLQPDQVAEMVEEVMTKHQDSPLVRRCLSSPVSLSFACAQSMLMEVHEYLGQAFSRAEPEKDYVFSSELPGVCARVRV